MGYAVKSPPRRLAAKGRIGISKDARASERAATPRRELQRNVLNDDEIAARGRAAASDASHGGSPAPSDASHDRETASVEGREPSRKAASPLDTLAAIAEMEARSVERELGIARGAADSFEVTVQEPREGGRRTLVTPHNGSSSSLSHAEAGAEASWEPHEGSANREDNTKDCSTGETPGSIKSDEEETTAEAPESLEVKPDLATSQPTKSDREMPEEEANEPSSRSSTRPGARHRYPPHPYPPYRAWYPPHHAPPPPHYHHHPYHPPLPPHSVYHPYPPHYQHPQPAPYWPVTASKKAQSAAKKEVRKEPSAEGATGESKASFGEAGTNSEEIVATKPSQKLPPKKRKFRELAGVEQTTSGDGKSSCDRRSPSESPSVEHGTAIGDKEAGEEETLANGEEKERTEGDWSRRTKGASRRGRRHPSHMNYHPGYYSVPGFYPPPPPYGYPPPPYHYHRPLSRAAPQSRTRSDQRYEQRKEQGDKSNRGSVHPQLPPERVASNEKAAAITEKMVPSDGDDGEERVKQFSFRDNASVDDKQTKATDEAAATVGSCVHIHGTALASFLGKNVETADVPPFQTLVNYPEHLPNQRRRGLATWTSNDRETTHRNCAMCGKRCVFGSNASSTNTASPCSGDGNESDSSAPSSKSGAASSTTSISYQKQHFTIPRQNKGLCNSCDVKVWLYAPPSDDKTSVETGQIAIKWCKGCKNFRQWPHCFGEKTRATKCAKCRDRQRNKYARSKK